MTRLAACLALAFALARPQPAAAEAPLEFVTGPSYPPFTGDDLPEGGLAVALLEAALATQDRAMAVQAVDAWATAFDRVAAGEADAGFPYVYTRNRAEQVAYSAPLIEVQPELVAPADAPVAFDGSKASLEDKRVCLPQGYAPVKIVDDMIATGRLADLNPSDMAGCLHLLEAGRADFFIGNNYTWRAVVARSRFSTGDFAVVTGELSPNTLHVVVGDPHPDTAAILATVDAGLAEIRAEGTFDAIAQRYLEGGG